MAALLTVAWLGLAACKAGQGDRCRKQEECRKGLQCIGTKESRSCLDPKTANMLCKSYKDCKKKGWCSAKDGKCVPTDEDCARLESCKKRAHCTAQDGKCVATAQDCKKATHCRTLGLCTARDGECWADSDADCAQSQACTHHGRCTSQKVVSVSMRKDGCVATSSEDCKRVGLKLDVGLRECFNPRFRDHFRGVKAIQRSN